MLQCLFGSDALLGIELKERVRYRFALDDVVQPWKIVTQFPWSIETYNTETQTCSQISFTLTKEKNDTLDEDKQLEKQRETVLATFGQLLTQLVRFIARKMCAARPRILCGRSQQFEYLIQLIVGITYAGKCGHPSHHLHKYATHSPHVQ